MPTRSVMTPEEWDTSTTLEYEEEERRENEPWAIYEGEDR